MPLDSSFVVLTMGAALVFILLLGLHFGALIANRYKTKFVNRFEFALPQLFLFSSADRVLLLNIGFCMSAVFVGGSPNHGFQHCLLRVDAEPCLQ
jgi:hypothetical protein